MGKYRDAVQAYGAKEYKKALELFQVIFLQDLQNAELNYMMGRSAFELKDYETALSAYERVLITKPDHIRTRLEYGRVLYLLGMAAEAREEFETVLKYEKLPENVRQNVLKFIDAIDNNREKHTLATIAMFGFAYDDNMDDLTDTQSYIIPAYNLELTRTDNKDQDISHSETLILAHNYDFGQAGKFSWDSMIIGLNQQWLERADKNVKYLSITTGPKYAYRDHTVYTPVVLEKVWYGTDYLMSMYDFYPQYSYAGYESWTFGSKFKYQRKAYYNHADREKSGLYLEWEESAKKKFTEKHTGDMTLKYMMERRHKGDTTSVDLDAYSVKFSHTYTFSSQYNLNSAYTMEKTLYMDTDTNYYEKRSDEQHDLLFTLTYQHDKRTSLIGTAGRTHVVSNQPTSAYEANSASLSMMYIF